MLERGRGALLTVKKRRMVRKAAKLGYGPAMTRLGDLEGNPEWYKKAVAKLDPPAFGKLGLVTGDSALFRARGRVGRWLPR